MHAAILQVLTGDPGDQELSSYLGDGLPAAAISRTEYLDGQHITHGTLAGKIETTTRVPLVTDDSIGTEKVEGFEHAMADVYIDLDGGWAGASTSQGEKLLADYLLQEVGVIPEDSVINIDAWAERLQRRDDADVWGVSYSQSIDDGHTDDRAGAQYHDDVELYSMPVTGKSAIGFGYMWDGQYAEGMIAASGYVALYNDWTEESFARFIADEVVDYLSIEEQDELPTDDSTDATDEETCTKCGRETDTNADGLCVVCEDNAAEGGEADA